MNAAECPQDYSHPQIQQGHSAEGENNNYTMVKNKVMIFISIFCILMSSCSQTQELDFESDIIRMGSFKISNGNNIEVFYKGGGATAPDVVWVKNSNNSGTNYIAKVLVPNQDLKALIFDLGNNKIKLRLTFTKIFIGEYMEYNLDLNNKIFPNDNSEYIPQISKSVSS